LGLCREVESFSTKILTATDLSNRVNCVQTPSQNWKIYLDTCCLNRFFNDQTQPRIRQETEAVAEIISHFIIMGWQWISSQVLIFEVNQNKNLKQRLHIKELLTYAHHTVPVAPERLRGKQISSLGFQNRDALHIACAESVNTDILLTTDDRMLKRAQRFSSQLRVRVENPYTWLRGMAQNEQS